MKQSEADAFLLTHYQQYNIELEWDFEECFHKS